jgi:putative hydrolase of the HAD superfamily
MRSVLPKAVFLDLDDTIVDDSSTVDQCWSTACLTHRAEYPGVDPTELQRIIQTTSTWFWGDAERHRTGRLDLDRARTEVVRLALAKAGVGRQGLAERVAAIYAEQRDASMQLLPEAIDTVRWLRDRGSRLALLTNGAGGAQRRKILRFGLADLFDEILVEGELGYGKPDERMYRLALHRLNVESHDAWMVGDNLDWDVQAPQMLGLFAIWIDVKGQGLPAHSKVRPDKIVRTLAELMK